MIIHFFLETAVGSFIECNHTILPSTITSTVPESLNIRNQAVQREITDKLVTVSTDGKVVRDEAAIGFEEMEAGSQKTTSTLPKSN